MGVDTTNRTIGGNLNTNAIANVSDGITLNASTSVKIADAATTENNKRIFFRVCNTSAFTIWVKLQPAAKDNDKKGICIHRDCFWEMPSTDKYVGEISAIAETDSPVIYVTEY